MPQIETLVSGTCKMKMTHWSYDHSQYHWRGAAISTHVMALARSIGMGQIMAGIGGHLGNAALLVRFAKRSITTIALCLIAGTASGQDQSTEVFGRSIVKDDDIVAIVRGDSPRAHGVWYEYDRLRTPLRGNFIVSDVLSPSDQWYDSHGNKSERFDISRQTPENYHNSHNHYENILSEVLNYTPGANGVAFWGDSAAVVNGASAWGGFVSARSSCDPNDSFEAYNKDKMDRGCGPDFDAQLTGLGRVDGFRRA
jgi:hypothetical protein